MGKIYKLKDYYLEKKRLKRNMELNQLNNYIRSLIPVCCPKGSDIGVHPKLVDFLYSLNFIYPLSDIVFTSGVRCINCNKIAGGKPNSLHLQGLAVDIKISNSKERYNLLVALLKCGATRLGIGKDFVHVDLGDSAFFPDRVIWLY